MKRPPTPQLPGAGRREPGDAKASRLDLPEPLEKPGTRSRGLPLPLDVSTTVVAIPLTLAVLIRAAETTELLGGRSRLAIANTPPNVPGLAPTNQSVISLARRVTQTIRVARPIQGVPTPQVPPATRAPLRVRCIEPRRGTPTRLPKPSLRSALGADHPLQTSRGGPSSRRRLVLGITRPAAIIPIAPTIPLPRLEMSMEGLPVIKRASQAPVQLPIARKPPTRSAAEGSLPWARS